MSGCIKDYINTLSKDKNICTDTIYKILEESIMDIHPTSEVIVKGKKIFIKENNIEKEFNSLNIDRSTTSKFIKSFTKKINEAVKSSQYNYFQSKIGKIVKCTVRKITYSNYIVEVNEFFVVLPKFDCLPQDRFSINDEVYACVEQVYKIPKSNHQTYLSRKSNNLLIELLKKEVADIQDENIIIHDIARQPGSRCKIVVYNAIRKDENPLGGIIGAKGSKIRNISDELKGEKIDLIHYSEDKMEFVLRCFSPIEVKKIIVEDEKAKLLTIVVHKDEYSKAIGRDGQNVRLLSKITGYTINILSEDEEKENLKNKFIKIKENFSFLNLKDEDLHKFFNEGINKIDDLVISTQEDLEDLHIQNPHEILNLAQQKYEEIIQNLKNKYFVEESFINLLKEHITLDDITLLFENNILNVDNLLHAGEKEIYKIVKDTLLEDIEKLILQVNDSNNRN